MHDHHQIRFKFTFTFTFSPGSEVDPACGSSLVRVLPRKMHATPLEVYSFILVIMPDERFIISSHFSRFNYIVVSDVTNIL